MKTIIQNNINSDFYKPFIGAYNVYISYDENSVKDALDRVNFSYSENMNCESFFNLINFSWDGDVYFFPNSISNKIEEQLNQWFLNSTNHKKMVSLEDTLGVFNFLMLRKTNRGLYIIDTQRDLNSTFSTFIKDIGLNNDEYEFYTDSHLIDNIKIGRNDLLEDIKIFKQWYIDGIIDESFFFYSDDLEEVLNTKKTINIITKNKNLLSILENIDDDLPIKTNSSKKNIANTWYDDSLSDSEIAKLKNNNKNVLLLKDGIINFLNNYENSQNN